MRVQRFISWDTGTAGLGDAATQLPARPLCRTSPATPFQQSLAVQTPRCQLGIAADTGGSSPLLGSSDSALQREDVLRASYMGPLY